MIRALRTRLEKLEPQRRKRVPVATILRVRTSHHDEDVAAQLQALALAGTPYLPGDPLIIIGIPA